MPKARVEHFLYMDGEFKKIIEILPPVAVRHSGNSNRGIRARFRTRELKERIKLQPGEFYLLQSELSGIERIVKRWDKGDEDKALTEIKSVISFAIWRQHSDLSHDNSALYPGQMNFLSDTQRLLSELEISLKRVSELAPQTIGYEFQEVFSSRVGADELAGFQSDDLPSYLRKFIDDVNLWNDVIVAVSSNLEAKRDEKQLGSKGGPKVELWVYESVFLLANIWWRYDGTKPSSTYNDYKIGSERYSPFCHLARESLGLIRLKRLAESFPRTPVRDVAASRFIPDARIYESAASYYQTNFRELVTYTAE